MLAQRPWVPEACETYIQSLATQTTARDNDAIDSELHRLVEKNRIIHEHDCINLNPATNVMNPRAEALLSGHLGSRPSLGYPGDKYEMGLEAIEQIEVMTAELAAEVFDAQYAEIRVGSGALANMYIFLATTNPGDAIIAPSLDIGGHITHHKPGAAGWRGVVTHPAPVDPDAYSVNLDQLRKQAIELRPKLITIGGSLNLYSHPIREIRAIADEVGAWVLYDAAHMSGMIAGKAWQQPLEEGAHAMTMSTYKSLGGPPSGLILTNNAELAERLDHIAFPGLTANFDVAKSASLAMTLLDWKAYGHAYAHAMGETAKALASELDREGVELFACAEGFTSSHQFAIAAKPYGGGQAAAKKLRQANILSCGIGLPLAPVEGDMNGLRIGTPEITRWGMTADDMPQLAHLIRRVLRGAESVADIALEVTEFRSKFNEIHYIRKPQEQL